MSWIKDTFKKVKEYLGNAPDKQSDKDLADLRRKKALRNAAQSVHRRSSRDMSPKAEDTKNTPVPVPGKPGMFTLPGAAHQPGDKPRSFTELMRKSSEYNQETGHWILEVKKRSDDEVTVYSENCINADEICGLVKSERSGQKANEKLSFTLKESVTGKEIKLDRLGL